MCIWKQVLFWEIRAIKNNFFTIYFKRLNF